jgi:SAM-dependent methyltransferase
MAQVGCVGICALRVEDRGGKAPKGYRMKLTDLQYNWDEFGRTDPLWAILSDPTKRGGRWGLNGFFETGRAEVAEVMEYLQTLPVKLQMGRALDFGCGVGRLTQALAERFVECHGVDIAASMLELANKYNRFGARCRYHLNTRPDLALFDDETFDFVYSNLVLQHMAPEYSTGYLKEFIRVLARDGLLLFQLPGEPVISEQTPELSLDARALPNTGFRADIRCSSAPQRMKASSIATIVAQVKNMSDVLWPASCGPHGRFRIQLGNHWLDRKGRVFMVDDARAPLPCDLGPGEQIDLQLTICAPAVNGDYILELDMVQELEAWFAAKGSATTHTRVKVAGGQSRAPYTESGRSGWPSLVRKILARAFPPALTPIPAPVMEMHGVPKAQVIDLLRMSGGQVIDVQRYDVAGDQWVSYRYCVTKA